MRLIVFSIIVILVTATLYTLYGITTFDPEKPAPLVFQEPTAEELRKLGVLIQNKPAPVLNSQQKEQAEKALAVISEAVSVYQGYQQASPLQLRDTISIITAAVGSGQLPAYFLGAKEPQSAQRTLGMIKINPASALKASETEPDLSCDGAFTILYGDENHNTLQCQAPATQEDDVFLGGPGNDTITDTLGNRIVNAGPGNDTIELGQGRSIIVLEPDWGQDRVNIDCRGATVEPSEIPTSLIPWTAKYSNFILVSSRIPDGALTWKDNVLTNTASGDTLTVNENCFNLVRAAE